MKCRCKYCGIVEFSLKILVPRKQSILMVFFVISMCDVMDICHAVVIALRFVSTLRLVVDLIFPLTLHV